MSVDLAVFRLELVPGEKDTYQMVFGLGRRPQRVSGIEKLIQLVVKLLLTTPGTDEDHLSVGGGLQRLLLKPLNPASVPSVQEDVAISVTMIEDEILRTQESEPLPADERLSSLTAEEISFKAEDVTWRVVIRLVSEAGQDFVLDLSDLLQPAG